MKRLKYYFHKFYSKRFVSASLILICFIYTLTRKPIFTEAIQWVEVPEHLEGHQWWDVDSLRRFSDGNLNIHSRFVSAIENDQSLSNTVLYVMDIDCSKKLFRDSSINGIPKLNPEWESPNGDGLINDVILDACSH